MKRYNMETKPTLYLKRVFTIHRHFSFDFTNSLKHFGMKAQVNRTFRANSPFMNTLNILA